ncbi:MAG: hypothetical protein ACRYFZ_09080 [Janthinobacterium lividum]
MPTLPLLARWLPDSYRRPVLGLFFGLVVLLGLARVPDYGSFIDEDSCRESGQISLVYLYGLVPPGWLPARAAARLTLATGRNRLENYTDRDYGVALELPLAIIEKLTGYTDMGDIIRLRHRCVWLVCCGGLVAFYWLAVRRLGSWRIGLLGAGLLLLSPRLFADFFYNSKDAVFLAGYLVATATAVAFVGRPSLTRACWHALACALAIDIRLMGVLVPVLTLGLLTLRALHGEYQRLRVGRAVLLFAGLLPLLVLLFWPYLWAAPAERFGQAWGNMSHFRWLGDLLYRGQLISTANPLPWHYPVVWLGITTPLLYLVGLALALGLLVQQLMRRGWRLYATAGEWQDLLLWGLGLGPFLAVILFQSVLYDGWRQLYFAYPPLLLLALRGLMAAWRWQPLGARLRAGWQAGVALVVAASLASTAGTMARLHPLENLYFNALAGRHPELRYETDYWGLSFRQGLAWIMRHDARPVIVVRTNLPAADVMSCYLLPPADRARLVIQRSPTGPADYFMTTYRYHPQPYGLGAPVYSLRVLSEGQRVFDIFRLR